RRGADGRGQPAGPHAHGVDRDLRRGPVLELRRRGADLPGPPGRVLRRPRRHLRPPEEGVGRLAPAVIVDIEKTFPGRPGIACRLELPSSDSAVTVLFGPSGAGKTAAARCL